MWPGIILAVSVATTLLPFEYRRKAVNYLTVFRHLWHNLLWRLLEEGCRKLMLGAFVLCHVSRAGRSPRGFLRDTLPGFLFVQWHTFMFEFDYLSHTTDEVFFKCELLFPLSLSLFKLKKETPLLVQYCVDMKMGLISFIATIAVLYPRCYS